MTTPGVPPDDLQKICNVFTKHPHVQEAILYGSRAKGTHRPGSDIDLTLKGDQVTIHDLTRIMDELDDLLLPNNIDLSLYAAIDHEDLREHIRRVGLVIYRTQSRPGTG